MPILAGCFVIIFINVYFLTLKNYLNLYEVPGVTPTLYPRFTELEVEKFVAQNYSFVVKAKCLVSDIGQNFYLRDNKGKEYIFKIANPDETYSSLDAQNKVILSLQGKVNFEIPDVYQTKDGKYIFSIKNENETIFYCRLFSFIKGDFLKDLKEHPQELQFKLGSLLGSLDQQLKHIKHSEFFHFLTWDLKNVLRIRKLIHHIKNPRRRSLVEYFLLQFETEVVQKFPELREGLIHNDANDYNIVVNQNRITGIIDFGDMVHSYIIFELAVALAYIMFNKANPVEETLQVIAGYHKNFSLLDIELDVLFYSICARLCLSVTMSAYQKENQPDNSYVSVSEESAWKLLWKLIEFNPNKARQLYATTCDKKPKSSQIDSVDSIIAKRKSVVSSSLTISYKKPLKIVRGAMQYLFDEKGESYLDCVNNVCHVGHCHPHVVKAAQQQIAVLNTNTRYLHDNLADYAERLSGKLPDPLNVCFFVNSGSEANELALRLAYAHTNQKNIIILDNAYHGNTASLVDISPYKYDSHGGKGPGLNTFKAEMPDLYRGTFKKNDLDAGKKYAKLIDRLIQKIENNNKSIAAFMCESLPGCGGQIVFPDGYLKEVYKRTRKAGGICIADEVQVGFGRVGSHFWGFELQGVVPDIVTLGKPIGNGHPLAAVVTTKEIADSFNNGMEFFNTFGGNPVSCAIGMAVLDVIESEELQANALEVGRYLINGLEKLKSRFDIIGDVRGSGLFIGIELVKSQVTLEPATEEAALIIEKMKTRGILISTDGPFNNVLKLKPPIIFTKENAERVIWNLDNVLKDNFS